MEMRKQISDLKTQLNQSILEKKTIEDKNLELIGKISELHMEMQTAKVV